MLNKIEMRLINLLSLTILFSFVITLPLNDITIREELLRRAEQLKTRTDNEIKKLEFQHKEYLAAVLRDEEERLDQLVDQLKNAPDLVDVAMTASELIIIEYRLQREVNLLELQSADQDLLLAVAQTLREWTAQEITDLRPLANKGDKRIQVIIFSLISEEQNIDRIAKELQTVQTTIQIQTLEVELRAAEIRLYEALLALGFEPHPTYATIPDDTTTPMTTEPTTTTSTTIHATTVSDTPKTSTVILTTQQTTTVNNIVTTESESEIFRKDLIKYVKDLEEYTTYEINRLGNITNRELEDLEKGVEALQTKLDHLKSSELLPILESELFWLEKRVAIEVEALEAMDKRAEKLLAVAIALKERLDSDINVLTTKTSIGQTLQTEANKLEKLSKDLKRANNDITFDRFESQLNDIEKRVNEELNNYINGFDR